MLDPAPKCFESTCKFYTLDHMRREIEMNITTQGKYLDDLKIYEIWARKRDTQWADEK